MSHLAGLKNPESRQSECELYQPVKRLKVLVLPINFDLILNRGILVKVPEQESTFPVIPADVQKRLSMRYCPAGSENFG